MTARSPRPSRPAASRTWARRGRWDTSPTGSARTSPPTRSGGSSGSSSTTGSTSPTRIGRPARRGSATAWERLVASWIRQVPPDHDSSDVTARRVLNWIYAWQGFGSGPLDAPLAESIAAQARHVRATLTPERNHRTLELYALLLAALAVPGLDGDGDGGLRRFALAELDRNLTGDFRADGVHREASTHYHMVALRSFLGVRANARRFGLPLPDGFEARLARASAFARHCHRPDGRIPALSDADTGSYPELLALADELLGPARRDARELPGRRLLRAAQRLGRRRELRRLRLRSARRRRPRPLRPAQRRALRARPAAGRRPRPRHVLRGAAEPAPLVPRHRGPQHRLRRRARPDAVHAHAPGRTRRAGPLPRPRHGARPRHARRRGAQPGLRRGAQPPGHAHRRRALGDRGPPARRDAAPLRPALPSRARTRRTRRASRATPCWRPGLAMRIEGAERIALEPGWVAPRYGEHVPAPVVSAVAAGVRDAAFVTQVRAAMTARPRPGRPAPRRAARRRRGGARPRRARAASGPTPSTASARACASSTAPTPARTSRRAASATPRPPTRARSATGPARA